MKLQLNFFTFQVQKKVMTLLVPFTTVLPSVKTIIKKNTETVVTDHFLE
jgi:hypothetical protein